MARKSRKDTTALATPKKAAMKIWQAAVDKDTALSARLVNQLIGRVTVNGPEDVSIDFAFESGFDRVMEVLGNE